MMLQFTNGFSCAMDQQKEELMINFIQQIPEIGDDGKTENVRIEEVINLVMGKVMAQNLLEALSEIHIWKVSLTFISDMLYFTHGKETLRERRTT